MRKAEAPRQTPGKSQGVIDGVEIFSTSYINSRLELPFADNDYEIERRRAVDKLTPNGIKPLTDKETEEEHKLTKAILKKAATSVFSSEGGRFCFPVAYSEPRSVLERLADMFTFLVNPFIDKARQATDPKDKLAMISTGVIACLHLDMQSKKPWNPILGETLCSRWPNGATFYAEQISHHPPISAVQIFAADSSWSIQGQCGFKTDNGMKVVEISTCGRFTLRLDGTEYEWEFPAIQILGNVSGERLVKVKGILTVLDKTHNMECFVEVGPRRDRKRGLDNPVATTIYGGLKQCGWRGADLGVKFTGDYCGSVFVGDKLVWNIETPVGQRPKAEVLDADLLPSDCRYRMDRCLFIKNRMAEADVAKRALEEAQRREAKLRKLWKSGKLPKTIAPDKSLSEMCTSSASELVMSSSREDLKALAQELSSDREEYVDTAENDSDK